MEAADGDTVSLLSPHSWEADIMASLLSLPQARLQVQPGSKSEHPSNFPQPEIFLKHAPPDSHPFLNLSQLPLLTSDWPQPTLWTSLKFLKVHKPQTRSTWPQHALPLLKGP